MRRRWKILVVIFVILGGITGGFLIWALTPPKPMSAALDALQSTNEVQVTRDPWYSFSPVGQQPGVGLIIYPGGRVDPRSYAPTAFEIAKAGIFVVIAPMVLNLAVFSPNKAGDVISATPSIATWAVGGHSLGGVMAAQYAQKNPSKVSGLVLWASYPSGDLSNSAISVLSIYATRDGLTSLQDIEDSKANLPPGTRFVAIEGGNHAQFGWYGTQSGDNSATITREIQQTQIVNETVTFLQAI